MKAFLLLTFLMVNINFLYIFGVLKMRQFEIVRTCDITLISLDNLEPLSFITIIKISDLIRLVLKVP